MLRKKLSRGWLVSTATSLVITIVAPLLIMAVPAYAAGSCTWKDSKTLVCGNETFSNPQVVGDTVNGNTLKLTGNTAHATGVRGAQIPCPQDTVVYNPTGNTASLVTYKGTGATCTQSKATDKVTNTWKSVQNPTQNAAAIAAATGNCPQGQTKDSQGNCAATSDNTLTCGSGALSWIICPVIKLAVDSANKLDSFIMDSLDIDVKSIFDSGKAAQGYYKAWNSFRIIAMAILVIAGLVMVASQALGFELLDAYTIRKVLPRLLIAIIGISLSWPLMRLVVDFFDTAGIDIRQLMYAPFSNLGGTFSVTGGLLTSLGAGAAIFLIGPASLTLILTALLAVFVGFMIIVIRQIAIIMLIIVAPVAIACYILPNTQRVWKLWYDNFLGLMLMFPIISGLIAAGHIFAAVALQPASSTAFVNSINHAMQFAAIGINPGWFHGHGRLLTHFADTNTGSLVAQATAIVAYFGPYFLLPMAARFATGIIGNIAGFVNDRHRGAFDRLKGVRQESMAGRHKDRMEGKTTFGSSRAGGVYRRASMMGKNGSWSATGRGRAKYEQWERGHRAAVTAEALKNDNGRAAGDDTANHLAQQGLSSREFLRQYADSAQAQYAQSHNGQVLDRSIAERQARDALGLLETGYGAKMGSDAMRVASWQAEQMSTTGYWDKNLSPEENLRRRFQSGQDMVNAGLMNASDAMATIKQNKGRVEASGVSFGVGMSAMAKGANNPISMTDIDDMMKSSLDGLTPGSLVGARKEAAITIAGQLRSRFEQTVAQHGAGSVQVKQMAGQIAGIQDTINSQAPQMAQVFADNLYSQQINGLGTTARDFVDGLRQQQDVAFNDVRKEWLGGGVNPQAVGGQQQQQPPQSDKRLKRNIIPIEQINEIQIYRFRYLWDDQEYVGVMAQDLIHTHPEALSFDDFGFYRVDYTKLGLRMMSAEDWEAEKYTAANR